MCHKVCVSHTVLILTSWKGLRRTLPMGLHKLMLSRHFLPVETPGVDMQSCMPSCSRAPRPLNATSGVPNDHSSVSIWRSRSVSIAAPSEILPLHADYDLHAVMKIQKSLNLTHENGPDLRPRVKELTTSRDAHCKMADTDEPDQQVCVRWSLGLVPAQCVVFWVAVQ